MITSQKIDHFLTAMIETAKNGRTTFSEKFLDMVAPWSVSLLIVALLYISSNYILFGAVILLTFVAVIFMLTISQKIIRIWIKDSFVYLIVSISFPILALTEIKVHILFKIGIILELFAIACLQLVLAKKRIKKDVFSQKTNKISKNVVVISVVGAGLGTTFGRFLSATVNHHIMIYVIFFVSIMISVFMICAAVYNLLAIYYFCKQEKRTKF